MKINISIIFFFFSFSLHASNWSPDKKSHLFQTYGLFTEEGQTGLLNQGKNRFWAELSSRITLVEFENTKFRPQVIINAGVMDSLRYENKEFQSDTQDLRVGLAVLAVIDSRNRFSLGLSHLSGHVLEDVPDKRLVPIDVGDEILSLRYLHDFNSQLRAGGTLKYILGTEGVIKRINGDQFLEWMPISESTIKGQSTPYTAFGFEENGFKNYSLSAHAQLGVYWGNHFKEIHSEIFRLLIGYYTGADPRQKFSHFEDSKLHFLYGGLSFEY